MTTKFSDLKLNDLLLRALEHEGYSTPTPIQQQAIPHLLQGHDLLGCAQTGTGKTAAFALPILQRLFESKRKPGFLETRALVLTPTRELALQIAESFGRYGKGMGLHTCVVFGGVNQNPQASAIRRGVDIVVATPGRLIDLVNQRLFKLSGLDVFVLDEADRMLDMGFIHDIKRIIKQLPVKRQNLFFSATMPSEISGLANSILVNPVKVEVTPPSTTVERIDQKVMFVNQKRKQDLLTMLLNRDEKISRVLIFTRTKHGANKVVEKLALQKISAEAIHGNKSQAARIRALENFKKGRTRVLVATDIAARGIDIDQISHVINFELPNVPESYVHRIGRTARAGYSGSAISFCAPEERNYLRAIERQIRLTLAVEEHSYSTDEQVTGPSPDIRQGRSGGGGSRPQGGGRNAGGRSGGGSRPQVGGRPQNRSGQNSDRRFSNPTNGNSAAGSNSGNRPSHQSATGSGAGAGATGGGKPFSSFNKRRSKWGDQKNSAPKPNLRQA
jgi:ATP-dependent RNA helicase RhlE